MTAERTFASPLTEHRPVSAADRASIRLAATALALLRAGLDWL